MLTNKEIGKRCKKYRVSCGYHQSDVAYDTGYGIENISSFENGRNDNGRILLWYFYRGMSINYLLGECDNG